MRIQVQETLIRDWYCWIADVPFKQNSDIGHGINTTESYYCINSVTMVTILLKYSHSCITRIVLKMAYGNAET